MIPLRLSASFTPGWVFHVNDCAATATLQGRLWKPAPPSTADITKALQLLEGAMKTLRVVGEDQSMGGPTDLGG